VPQRWRYGSFFAGLGVGYLAIEIALIQKFLLALALAARIGVVCALVAPNRGVPGDVPADWPRAARPCCARPRTLGLGHQRHLFGLWSAAEHRHLDVLGVSAQLLSALPVQVIAGLILPASRPDLPARSAH
jgi:hypothetical protein